jgi:hypothetical protein
VEHVAERVPVEPLIEHRDEQVMREHRARLPRR